MSKNNQLTSEILGLLPHRFPFMVDRVLEHVPGKKAVALKNITINASISGTSQDRPLMPGILIVESMAQVGGIIVTKMPDLPKGLFVLQVLIMLNLEDQLYGDQLVITVSY